MSVASSRAIASVIGAQLYRSARTVEWHLSKVFIEVGAHAGSCARPWLALGRRTRGSSDRGR